MPHKIGSRSFADFGDQEITIIVKASMLNLLLTLAFTVMFGAIIGFDLDFNLLFTGKGNYFILIFFLLPLVQLLNTWLYREETKMSMTTSTLVRKKIFAGIVLKSIYTKWPKDAYYKYENVYDSYKKITAIWLVAASKEKNESKRLVSFLHQDNFNYFRNLFNEEFPDHKILEWHD